MASLDDDTDFRIKLNGYTWRVHSQLISQESEFFQKTCKGDWKESELRLAEIHDDEPWMIGRMLQFFYYRQYDYDHQGGIGSSNKPGGSGSSISGSSTKRGGGGGGGGPLDPIPSSPGLTLDKLMSVGKRHDPSYEHVKAADAKYSQPEVDLHMYIVADKYGAGNLKTKILTNFVAQGKIAAPELLRMCDDTMRSVISRDYDLKRAVAGKVARCYRDTVLSITVGGLGIISGSSNGGGSGSTAFANSIMGQSGQGGGGQNSGNTTARERPMDEWLLADPQICLLAMEQMNAPF